MGEPGPTWTTFKSLEFSGWHGIGWILLFLLPLMASACANSSSTANKPAVSTFSGSHQTSQALRDEINRWLGTPHHLGGMSHRGIDCSGLVVVVYDEVFDLQLPRTTDGLIKTGKRVARKNLVSGDLVFFKPEYKSRHVGIYLGQGEFAHASSSMGVTISRLDNAFWQRCYVTGRRVR